MGLCVPDSDEGQEHKHIILFFDANVPYDLAPLIHREHPEVLIFVLQGKGDRNMIDSEILEEAEKLARREYFEALVFLVTGDKSFVEESQFGASSPVCILLISLPNSGFLKSSISDRINGYLNNIKDGLVFFQSGMLVRLPHLPR